MSASELRIVVETWEGASASSLRDRMDAELHPRYADLFRDVPHTPTVVDPADILFTLVAYEGDAPAGTASLKRTGEYAEVKRVFVDPAFRRRGLAARLLAAVEEHARGAGVRDLVLQTGVRQPEASALYEREGWVPIAPFGPYQGDDVVSRCYAKPLVPLTLGVQLHAQGDAATLVSTTTDEIAAWEVAGADIVIVPDSYLLGAGSLAVDAPTLATFAAARTRAVALVPEITTTHTEPFHVAKIIQTLDFVSRGRAGWQVEVTRSEADAALFGRKAATDDETELWAEAEEAIEVAERLWDSWEDDAEIRDAATGRFIDRDRVHHIDFEGRFFSVKGPSIVPRSPQGRPPIVIRVDGPGAALEVAARRADVIRVPAEAVTAARAALEQAGRHAAVLVDVPASDSVRDTVTRLVTVRTDTGADGAVLVFADRARPVAAYADALAPLGAGSSFTFRERLGLERPASRYAGQEINA